jgi:hypothetical protein
MSDHPSSPDATEEEALLQAAEALLKPLARLLVARGVHYGSVEERLKIAFVVAAREAALAATPDALPHRLVSRISTTTGINRREVTRLVLADFKEPPPRRSPALQAFARWNSDPAYLDAQGRPKALPRQGATESFEQLAASITRDVHPRSLLDDLLRLNLVSLDAAGDTVRIHSQAFVPREDTVRMLGYVGSNVGDHLKTAVSNVIGDAPLQFEQAIYAHGLSAESLQDLNQLAREQWALLTRALVPELQKRIDADAQVSGAAEPAGQVRIGLFVHAQGATTPPTTTATPTPGAEHED